MSAARPIDLDYERALLNGLGRLLLTSADFAQARATVLALRNRTAEAPATAFKHKITPIMTKNALDLMADEDDRVATAAKDLFDALQTDNEDALAHRSLLEAEVVRISRLLEGHACLIKGFCNARFYPHGYARWMRDIDIFCPSWIDALHLIDQLLDDGYDFDLDECSWIKADESHGREIYGQSFLIRPVGDDFCRIDIHYGTYSVGYAAYLAFPTTDFTSPLMVGNTAVDVLSAPFIPLIAASHALSDGYISVKDVNDFVALALATVLDWESIGQNLKAHQLQPQGAALANHVLKLYDHPVVVAAARSLLAGTGNPRFSLWETHNRSWSLRAKVNASFAFRWRMAQGGGLTSGVIDAGRCYLFYARRLHLVVRKRSLGERVLLALMAKPNLDLWELRPDACTNLIDTSTVERIAEIGVKAPDHDEAEWVATPVPGILITRSVPTLVRLRGRTCIPTLDLIVTPEDAKVAVNA